MYLFYPKLIIFICRWLSLWSLWIIPLLVNHALADAEPDVDRLRICLEVEDYPPYFFKPEFEAIDAGRTGILLDLIDKCAEAVGVEVEYVSKPWRRCLADVKDNRVDAIAPVIWSHARQALGHFPMDDSNQLAAKAALLSVEYAVFTHRDSPLIWDGERFTGIRYGVAAPLGHLAHRRLKHMGVLPASAFTVADGLTMVSRGFLDGFVAESLSGRFIANKQGFDSLIVEADQPFLSTELYLVFSHGYAEAQPQLMNKIWESLTDNGPQWRSSLMRHYSLAE